MTALAVVLATLMLSYVYGYTTGAPSVVCNTSKSRNWLAVFSDMCEEGPNLSGKWTLAGLPTAYEPQGVYTVTITGPTYTGFVMWAENGASLAITTHPSGGSLESGPLCTGKSTLTHTGRDMKSGGQIRFTAGTSGTIHVVAMMLGSRSGPDCQYEVLEFFIPPATLPPSTTTTTTTTTTMRTTTGSGTTTPSPPGQTTTRQASVCSDCVDENGLLEVGLMGSPRWCGCCANDCEGIFPSCVKKGFCQTFCYDTPECEPWTTTNTPPTSRTTTTDATVDATNSTSAATTTTTKKKVSTTKPQPVDTSSSQRVVLAISGYLIAIVFATV